MRSTLQPSDPLLVIIGPSACGKSTVVRELVNDRIFHVTPSWTTRPRRNDEQQGTPEHRFVTRQQFDFMRCQGFFLECVEPFGLPWSYGIPAIERGAAGTLPAVMLRAPFVELLRKHYTAPLIYQIEAETACSLQRLATRPGDAGTRADLWIAERDLGRRIAHRVFRNDGSVGTLAARIRVALQADLCEAA